MEKVVSTCCKRLDLKVTDEQELLPELELNGLVIAFISDDIYTHIDI